jgi:TPR repeat protein
MNYDTQQIRAPLPLRPIGEVQTVPKPLPIKDGTGKYRVASARARQGLTGPELTALLQAAIDEGDARASYALAKVRMQAGESPSEVAGLLEQAALRDVVEACFDYAHYLELETNDHTKALLYYLRAALLGDVDGLEELARCLYYGIGIAPEPGLASICNDILEFQHGIINGSGSDWLLEADPRSRPFTRRDLGIALHAKTLEELEQSGRATKPSFTALRQCVQDGAWEAAYHLGVVGERLQDPQCDPTPAQAYLHGALHGDLDAVYALQRSFVLAIGVQRSARIAAQLLYWARDWRGSSLGVL